jgi:hypothetical protein
MQTSLDSYVLSLLIIGCPVSKRYPLLRTRSFTTVQTKLSGLSDTSASGASDTASLLSHVPIPRGGSCELARQDDDNTPLLLLMQVNQELPEWNWAVYGARWLIGEPAYIQASVQKILVSRRNSQEEPSMPKQRRTTTRQLSSQATLQRPPVSQMSEEELHAWIHTTRAALHKKLVRERNYLDRRISRGTHTPTDDAYEADQDLLADLIALLDEMEASMREGDEGHG